MNNLEFKIKLTNIIKEKLLSNYNFCKKLILILDSNKNIIDNIIIDAYKIMKLFPPKINFNKFIYGKLIERSIKEYFSLIFNFIDLDEITKNGSYKDDCLINNFLFSIKATKNGGQIILINKNNRKKYDYQTNLIILNILSKKLYIFPTLIIPKKYIVNDGTKIAFKSSIFKFLDLNYKEYIYNFDCIINENINLKEIKLIENLYNTIIKN